VSIRSPPLVSRWTRRRSWGSCTVSWGDDDDDDDHHNDDDDDDDSPMMMIMTIIMMMMMMMTLQVDEKAFVGFLYRQLER
jgi:hypothetical protein